MVNAGVFSKIDLFDYKGVNDIHSISVKYNEKPHKRREKGTYTMIDEKAENRSLVFQYYIYDQNFKQLNNNNATASFNKPPDAEIRDKYTVVIRQVVILNNSEEAVKKSV